MPFPSTARTHYTPIMQDARFVFAVWLLLVTGNLPGRLAGAPRPLEHDAGHIITIPKVVPAPVSADLDHPPWTQAAVVTGFLLREEPRLAAEQTWVHLGYDDAALLVAFRCEGRGETQLKRSASQPDDMTWRDDSVELLLDPWHSHQRFIHFAVNSAGVVYDAWERQREWRGQVEVQTASDDQGWTLAMRIPFAELRTGTPADGTVWAVNFCHTSSRPERSTWAPIRVSYQTPEAFGHVVFGGTKVPLVRFRKVDDVTMGENRLILDPAGNLRLLVEGKRDRQMTGGAWPARQEGRIGEDGSVSFALHEDRIRRVDLRFLDANGITVARCWYPMTSPEVAARVPILRKRFDESRACSHKLPEVARRPLGRVLAEVRQRLDEAERITGDPKLHSQENWERLQKLTSDLAMSLDGPWSYARMAVQSPRAGFAVGLAGSMEKVMIKDFPFEGAIDDHYDLSLARNEHEGFQVVVIPVLSPLTNVSVSVSPLQSVTGAGEFIDGKVGVALVGHVDVADQVRYDADYHGWWPDPLLDFQTSCDAQPGEHVAFWIDVAASARTPAGNYRGTVAVKAEGQAPIELRLNVHVWDFELPQRGHLPNAFTYHEPMTRGFYRGTWNDQLARKYDDLILDHRLNIDHLYRGEPPDIEVLKYGSSKGMNAFNVGSEFRQDEPRNPEKLAAYIEKLKEEGLFDDAYVYGFDEVKAEKFTEMREAFGLVRRRYPGLKTMTTAQDRSFGLQTGLRDVVDIWVPLIDAYDLAEARRLRAEGKKMWWYICIVPPHPYPNWFIEYPAIEARLLTGAMSYKYEVDGLLYYLINEWQPNRRWIAKGPYTEWNPASFSERKDPDDKEKITAYANGDGSLICPGPNGPLSTVRLENTRDGFEDYEYLCLLKELSIKVRRLPETPQRKAWLERAGRLLAVPDDVVRTTTNYTHDPARLATFRAAVAETIVEGTMAEGRH